MAKPRVSYVKLFKSVITSTIWTYDAKTCVVWITMMVTADKRGMVKGTTATLANLANVSINDCRASLDRLLAPDEHAATKHHNGSIVEKVKCGWMLRGHQESQNKFCGKKGFRRRPKSKYHAYLCTKKWQDISEKVKIRDGYKCQKCESTKKLNVHHKTYDNIYNEAAHLGDLVTLCNVCHRKEHGL